MRKKTILHRRNKQFFRKFLALVTIFFITFGLLLVIFSIGIVFRKNSLLSPLSGITRQISRIIPVQNTKQTTIAELLAKTDFSPEVITTATDSSILVDLKDGKEIIFSQNKKLDQQIASLQLITKQLTIEGKRFNRIDFRFDNPVVTFY